MPVRDDIRLERFERVFGAMLEAGLTPDARVRWSGQHAPAPAPPFAAFGWTTPPEGTCLSWDESHAVPSSVQLTIANTEVGNRDRLVLVNGFPFAAAGDDDTEVRDALVEAIEAGEEPVSAAAVDDDALVLTPVTLGELQRVAAFPTADVAVDVLGTSNVTYQRQSVQGRLWVDCYAIVGAGQRVTAATLAREVETLLETRELVRLLGMHGFGISVLPGRRDLSATAGTEFEARVQLELLVGFTASLARAHVPIDTATILGTTNDHTHTTSIETPP